MLSALKVGQKIVATGGTPLGTTDCLNFGSPNEPAVMFQFVESIRGISDFTKAFNIPVVSGNVSFHNVTNGHPIPPTPMLGMVGYVEDVSQICLSQLVRQDHYEEPLCFFHVNVDDNSSCDYGVGIISWLSGEENYFQNIKLPHLEREQELWTFLRHLQKTLSVRYCRPVGNGGIYFALQNLLAHAKTSLKHQWTEQFLSQKAKNVFAEGQAGFIFSIPQSQIKQLQLLPIKI